MGLLNRIRRRIGEVRSLIEGRWHRIDFGPTAGTTSGVDVNPRTALTMTAAYACINVIATDVAMLPLDVYRKVPGGGRVKVDDHPAVDLVGLCPDEETTSIRWRQAQMGQVLGWGNGYAEVERTRGGVPVALHLLDQLTYPDRTGDGRLFYPIRGGKTLPAADVIHVAGLGYDGLVGYSPVRMARQAIGLGLAAEAFGASLFGNGAVPKGKVKTPKKLTPMQVRNIRESIESAHQGAGRANRVMILEEGLDWEPTSIDPEDAQFLATRQFQVLEVARIYRVPPHKIGDYSQSHLANIEASNLDYLTTTLMPWLVAIEQELNRKLFTREERKSLYVEHNMAALLRGDMAARSAFYDKMRNLGALSPNEIRTKENMNPIPGGDVYLVPLNMCTLDQAGQNPKAVGVDGKPTG